LDISSNISNPSIGTIAYYTPDMISYSHYLPFGQIMPGRHGQENSYKYGFQGQERDDEMKGNGNSLNYKYRMHDPRIGRFFAVDPMAREYSYNSPYAFSENCVIQYVELEGLEKAIQPMFQTKNGVTKCVNQSQVGKADLPENRTPKPKLVQTPVGYPEMKSTTVGDMQKREANLERKERLEQLQNSPIGDMAKVGQGLLYGPEAAATVFVPEMVFAKFLKYVPQAQKAVTLASEFIESFKPINEYDPMITLYRGTTGSESSGNILFTAKDASAAASYVKNGGQLVEYNVSLSSMRTLEATGQLSTKTGINKATGEMTTEFMFEGEELKKALNTIAKPAGN
jgi:RHS repeat-associated protein